MGLCLASLAGLKLAWDEFTLGCGVGIFPGGGSGKQDEDDDCRSVRIAVIGVQVDEDPDR